MKAWCNGAIVAADSPQISILDHGFTVGDGVFETLKAIKGHPFALSRHLARLQRSAAGLGLPVPDPGVVREAVHAALAANNPADTHEARIRITYTSGPGVLGSDRGPGPVTLSVAVQPGGPWPPTTTVAVAPWPRNERSPLVGLKTTSYGENAVALAWAKAAGHSEALLANLAGDLCEGTGSNVFVGVGGRLLTPPLSAGCLAGTVRGLVLEWCGAAEERLPLTVLAEADEVFITSSTREVHPVVAIGERNLAVGPLTRSARATFAERAAAGLDP
jgi:branched-chain amino acid aminotransferase